jgi:DNA-binding transcriptional LysR family regulator
MDSLSALDVFVRAAETRSFTDAGRRLSVSSSAVGKTISRLENRLGVRLFHRSTRAITLTREGELFLESCRRIFSEINKIELELSESKATPKGRLKVSLPDVGTLMMPTLHGFMREYSDIQIDAEFTDNMVDVIDGGYDAVIRSGEQSDSRLMSKRLGSYRLEVVGAPTYFARHGMPLTPEDLKLHACLHHRYPSSGKLQRWPFTKAGSYADIELPISAAVTTIEPLVSLACVPNFAVRRQIEEGSLIRILDEYIEHVGVFSAVWPPSQHHSPKLRAFVDYMAEHLFPNSPSQTASANRVQARRVPAGEASRLRPVRTGV